MRAAQLAYFAIMMKARQYDRRFFSRGVQPHVYAIVESGHTDKDGKKHKIMMNMRLSILQWGCKTENRYGYHYQRIA